MKKTIFRLVDNLYPRVVTSLLFVIVIVCTVNAITAVLKGDYNTATFFGFLTLLFCVLTDLIYKKLWTPKKSSH